MSFDILLTIWRLFAIFVIFAILFDILLTIWQLLAISAIFAKIATFKRDPLPSHLELC